MLIKITQSGLQRKAKPLKLLAKRTRQAARKKFRAGVVGRASCPVSRLYRTLSASQGNDRARGKIRHRDSTEPRPFIHESPAFLEKVAASICLLHFVADRVRQCLLQYMICMTRLVSCPIAEGRTE